MKQQILQKAIDNTLYYLELLHKDANEKHITKQQIIDRVEAIRRLLLSESG